MLTVKDICSYLEFIAPPALQEDYDNSGLIVGNYQQKVSKAIISLDCTEAVIDEAIDSGANMIISHHPIVFKGLKRLNGNSYIERTIIKAIKNDIAIYAIHTNLDSVMGGVNSKICDKLGLINTQILQPKKGLLKKIVTFCPVAHTEQVRKAMFDAGAGNIGNYNECSFNISGEGTFRGNKKSNAFVGEKEILHREQEVRIETIYSAYQEDGIIKALLTAHPYEEVAYDIFALGNHHPYIGSGMVGELTEEMDTTLFLKMVKQIMNCESIRYTDIVKPTVKRIAVCGGSGSFLLNAAKRAKADMFISADFKYHEFFDAENQIIIADIGHFESEQFTSELLLDKLSEKFTKFVVSLSKVNTNPINYC
jgi:dinuclear metal center YbgI/SA1388 family protein